MSGTYHYHYAAVVWNKDDFSDIHILKTESKPYMIFLKGDNVILFDTPKEAKDYATKKKFKHCEIVSLFHTKM